MFNKKTHDPDFEANPEFEQECLYCKRTILSCQEMQNSRHHYSADRSATKNLLILLVANKYYNIIGIRAIDNRGQYSTLILF